MIFHIAQKSDWLNAQRLGEYTCDSLETDGFIHCSTKDQVILVAVILFKNQKDLILLYIDELKVESKVIFEDLKGHGSFPHIYGKLNLDAVTDYCDLPSDPDGGFKLPDNLREVVKYIDTK